MGRFITQIGQSRAILSFVIIIGIILGYLSYSGSEPLIIPEQSDVASKRGSLDSLISLDVNFSILDEEDYKALEIFGENPVDPGITGERRNPFAPI